ncbi:protein N-lysine methyltransferase METTL21A [Cinnamomum micranthum f. kanehirae]|uniref:Protein N-lysine methyltransferase METTL21A n=1 Tax=Cinnamomum micranthum f. kanehirae TaxID=337451 RepID=A0A3S3MUG0_9MAGN|nr:protein N-lysine methyltransferase METTL21A [Cinnamomum micranthum f. kanehirae]
MKKPIIIRYNAGDCADRRRLMASLILSLPPSLPLNLPASAAIITSSYDNHGKQPLPLLSSPFHSWKQSHRHPTGFDLVLGAVEQLLHLRGGQCKFTLAHIPQVKMMDAMAVDEAIWHGMKISEVDWTRSMGPVDMADRTHFFFS